MQPIGDEAFIVMSGPPDKGKRERISKVRSHIKKGYFERKSEMKKRGLVTEHARSSLEEMFRETAVGSTLKNRVIGTTVPFGPARLDQEIVASNSSWRVQRCE